MEALVVQLLCTGYQLWLVHGVEHARLVNMLLLLGLPGPVLRTLSSRPVQVGQQCFLLCMFSAHLSCSVVGGAWFASRTLCLICLFRSWMMTATMGPTKNWMTVMTTETKQAVLLYLRNWVVQVVVVWQPLEHPSATW